MDLPTPFAAALFDMDGLMFDTQRIVPDLKPPSDEAAKLAAAVLPT